MNKNTYQKYFKRANEYYKNAKEILKDIPIEYDKFYVNQKKVQKSAGICHLSLSYAIKGYLIKKGIDEKKVNSSTWDGLKFQLLKYYPADGKFRKELEIAYYNVHINTYYSGNINVGFVKEGYNSVKYVIEKLSQRI